MVVWLGTSRRPGTSSINLAVHEGFRFDVLPFAACGEQSMSQDYRLLLVDMYLADLCRSE